jgi:hypothetical protein
MDGLKELIVALWYRKEAVGESTLVKADAEWRRQEAEVLINLWLCVDELSQLTFSVVDEVHLLDIADSMKLLLPAEIRSELKLEDLIVVLKIYHSSGKLEADVGVGRPNIIRPVAPNRGTYEEGS